MLLRKIILISFLIILTSCNANKFSILKKGAIDSYHGKRVNDPYRKLEDLKDSTVLSWLRNQERFSKKLINNIEGRERILLRQEKFDRKKSFQLKYLNITDNNTYFYIKRFSDDKIGKLYMRKEYNGREELIFDFKTFGSKGLNVNYIKPSWDGEKVVVAFTKDDKEFSQMRILNVKEKKFYPEVINHNWPSELGGIVWLPSNDKFIYSHLPSADEDDNILFDSSSVLHELGSNVDSFKVLLSKENNPELKINKEDFPITFFLNDERTYAFAAIAGTGFSDWYYKDISKDNWIPLIKKENKISWFKVHEESLIYLTSKDASNFKLCKTSFNFPDFNNPIDLVKEDPKEVLDDFVLTKEGIFYTKIKNGVEAKLFYLNAEGVERRINLPKRSGSIQIESKGVKFSDLWVEIEGWVNTKERYRYNIEKDSFIKEEFENTIQYDDILDNVVVEEIEVESYDGVLVPLSIVYRKNIKLDGNNRVLINGYGAYGWSNTPYLYPYLLHWLAEGGIYAVAHVRGGGEKGDVWHRSGQKLTKPNTWKDFIACTEYMIEKGYTIPSRMAAWGASAGGVTIGRAITERPDLYKVAIVRVGALNKLRSESGPNGSNGTKEFGSVEDPKEFKALLEMDAYQHIRNGQKYPAVYLTAGINDTRVPAWQPAKFAARMQEATTSGKPVLLSVDFDGGHGFEATQDKKNKELADILSFALWQTGHPDYQLKENIDSK